MSSRSKYLRAYDLLNKKEEVDDAGDYSTLEQLDDSYLPRRRHCCQCCDCRKWVYRIMLSLLSISLIGGLCFYTLWFEHPLSGCPRFEGSPGDLVFGGPVDLRLAKGYSPLDWHLTCVSDSTNSVSFEKVHGSDADFGDLTNQTIKIDETTGDVLSHIPNRSVVVALKYDCLFGLTRWRCLIPHLVIGDTHPSSHNEATLSAYSHATYTSGIDETHPLALFVLALTITLFVFFCMLSFCKRSLSTMFNDSVNRTASLITNQL